MFKREMWVILGLTFGMPMLGLVAALFVPAWFDNGEPQFPDGWRTPIAAETNQEWRDDNADRYLRARADFDGDGRSDRALLLVNRATKSVGLFVFLAHPDRSFALHELYVIDEPAFIAVMGVDVAGPGTHRIMCHDDDQEPCGSDGKYPLVLDLPAVDSFKDESASSLFHWNRQARSFEQLWTSD